MSNRFIRTTDGDVPPESLGKERAPTKAAKAPRLKTPRVSRVDRRAFGSPVRGGGSGEGRRSW